MKQAFIPLGFLLTVFVIWILSYSARETALVVLEDGTRLTVEIAETPAAKMRGLSGRDEISHDGMLFVYDAPQDAQIWMKDMNFPIDIVWIADGRVVHVVEGASPDDRSNREVYRAVTPVEYVLEMESGEANRLGIEIGDMVDVSISPKGK